MGAERAVPRLHERRPEAVAPESTTASRRLRSVDPVGDALDLQQAVGNRATVELLRVGQAKLDVGAADDRYEREADTVARQVVATLQSSAPSSRPGPAEIEDEASVGRVVSVSQVQRQAVIGAEGGTLDAATESAIDRARTGGTALEGGTRSRLEDAFGGVDFAGVRLHAGSGAAALNERVQAKAFTVGSDIFFRGGLPDDRSAGGQALLAHELTHTIQQGS